ncbi:MAG: riboflavin synthase [Bacteroidia bacterium]
MFTGIIEQVATIEAIKREGSNITFSLKARFPQEPIKVDQSIAHDGVCLTVTETQVLETSTHYAVTAVEETLNKTGLGGWKVGNKVNLERCLKVGARLDGHFVQGHVDTTGTVTSIEDRDGSWNIHFRFPEQYQNLLVDKGSICINGVSLTVVASKPDSFSVTIIPYTWEHTNFHQLAEGDTVNLEFDILGKYMLKAQGLNS